MKKILITLLSLIACVSLYAQKDVTRFLGFPVDGPKSTMIRNLESKGFKLNNIGDVEYLSGVFNGVEVHVYIATENGKVSRIMVCDENPLNETDIKIRFNRLCRQFKENGKYIARSLFDDLTIADDEDISYEMGVHNKSYEAAFYQLPEGQALEELQASLRENAKSRYTPEQLENPTLEMKMQLIDDTIKAVENKSVWFMIVEEYGQYYITMFYDNEYNKAHGEDL